jgi:hypothetical protein
MKSIECPLKYIGQRGRIFHTRYREHIQENICNNDVYVNNPSYRMMVGVIGLDEGLLFNDASCILVSVVCYRLFAHVYFKIGVWNVG